MKSCLARLFVHGNIAIVGLVLGIQPAGALTPPNPAAQRAVLRQQIVSLTQRRQALEAELAQEMKRVQEYLTYQDQILCIKSIRNEFQIQNIPDAIARSANQLYQSSHDDAEMQTIIAEHRQAATALFEQIDRRVAESLDWPTDRTMDEYRAAAKAEMHRIQAEYLRKRTQPAELAGLLGRATEVLSWTNGRAQSATHENPFAKSSERAAQAIAAEHQRNVNILASHPPRPLDPETMTHGTNPPPNIDVRMPPESTRPPGVPGSTTQATVDFGQVIQAAVNAVQQGRHAEGLQLFELAVRANPASETALSGLAFCQNALGQIDAALGTYEALYRAAPQSPGLRSWFAELLLAKGDYGAARQWLEPELQAHPNSAWALSWLGSVEWAEGKEQQARQAFARAMQADSQVARMRFDNGVKHWTTQPARAIGDFTAALWLDPSWSGAYYYLGDCYARLNQRELAARYLQAYIQADPTSEWTAKARQRLADLESPVAR